MTKIFKTKYSISEASRITGKVRATIRGLIKRGRLSVEVQEDGRKLIDASELRRHFGDDLDFDLAEPPAKRPASTSNSAAAKTVAAVEPHLNQLQKQLDREIEERERERRQLQEQIDRLQDTLKLAQEGQNKAMLLLENQSQGSSHWELAIKSLEERIANQEQTFMKRVGRLRQQARQEAIDVVRSQPWWRLVLR